MCGQTGGGVSDSLSLSHPAWRSRSGALWALCLGKGVGGVSEWATIGKSQDPWPRHLQPTGKTRHQAPTHVKGEESDLAITRGGDGSGRAGLTVPRGLGQRGTALAALTTGLR